MERGDIEWFLRYGQGETLEVAAFLGYEKEQTMKRKQNVDLYLNSATDWTIVDDHKLNVTIEQARLLWESGRVRDYNVAFSRLVQSGFDVDAVKEYYAKIRLSRGM